MLQELSLEQELINSVVHKGMSGRRPMFAKARITQGSTEIDVRYLLPLEDQFYVCVPAGESDDQGRSMATHVIAHVLENAGARIGVQHGGHGGELEVGPGE